MCVDKGHIKQVGMCVFSSVGVENQDGGSQKKKIQNVIFH